MIEMKRSLWCRSMRCTSSWTITYSIHCTGFLISSRFSQMRRAAGLQVPHLVFILLTRYSMASDHIHCTSVAMTECYPPEYAPYEAEGAADSRHAGTAAFSATQNLFAIAVRVSTYRKLDMAHRIDRAYKPFADYVTSHP